MSMLIKELLHDLVRNKLSSDTRLCLLIAIENLYRSGTFKKEDILLLEYYLRGFNAEEIGIQFFLSTDTVNATLARLLLAIEHASGFLDELFLQKLTGKYSQNQIKRAREYLIKQSKDFSYENI